jgi:hypothetical protein
MRAYVGDVKLKFVITTADVEAYFTRPNIRSSRACISSLPTHSEWRLRLITIERRRSFVARPLPWRRLLAGNPFNATSEIKVTPTKQILSTYEKRLFQNRISGRHSVIGYRGWVQF